MARQRRLTISPEAVPYLRTLRRIPAFTIERVTVRCCRCDTVASLWARNLSTWRRTHVCRQLLSGARYPRPYSVTHAERVRAERNGKVEGVGTGEPTLGVGATHPVPAPSSASICGLSWGVDTCALPLGHDGECADAEGNGLEYPF